MTWKEFIELKAFNTLEPIGRIREDFNSANIAQAIATVTGKPGGSTEPLSEYLVHWGGRPEPEGMTEDQMQEVAGQLEKAWNRKRDKKQGAKP